MKKKSLSLVIFSLLFSGTAISGQMDSGAWHHQLDKTLLTLTLPEAKKELNNSIHDLHISLHQIEQLQSLKNIAVSSTMPAQASELKDRYVAKQLIENRKTLEQKLAEVTRSSFTFNQMIMDGNSQIAPDINDIYDVLVKYNADPYLDRVSGQISAIHFKNGQMQLSPQKKEALNAYKIFTVMGQKPIRSLDLTLYSSAYTAVKTVLLSPKQREVRLGDGELYRLTQMSDDALSLLIKTPKNVDYVIEGLAENGKPLSEKFKTESTMSINQDANFLKQNLSILKNAQRHFSQFKNTQDLINFIAQHKIEPPSLETKTSIISASFFGHVKSVQIQVLYDRQPLILNFHLINQSTHDYCIAQNTKTGKYGLVDNSGAWLFTPQFDKLDEKPQKNLFKIGTSESDKDGWPRVYSADYRLDNKKMMPLPFVVHQTLTDDLLVVSHGQSGLYGLYQWSAQRFLMPMQFSGIEEKAHLLMVTKQEKGQNPHRGLYSLAGKEILAVKYDYLDINDKFVYTKQGNEYSVFTLQGKKITPDGVNVIGKFVFDQPLLIQRESDQKYQFIDEHGQLLKFNLPYDEVSPFSNGMAIVEAKGKYGAINLQGKLVIPIMYDDLFCFQKNYAGAVLGDRQLSLIDRTNHTIAQLGYWQKTSSELNSNKNIYTVINGGNSVMFDADGHQIHG